MLDRAAGVDPMKPFLLVLVLALCACTPQPDVVPLDPPMCIVRDPDGIREVPCVWSPAVFNEWMDGETT